jgi:hypothetical protein
MKKDEVRIGSTYKAKVSGSVVPVRITEEKWSGDKQVGWVGTNTETGRSVRVKSAQRLRAEVGGKPAKPEKPEPPTPAAAEPIPQAAAPDAVAAAPDATAATVGEPAGNGAAPPPAPAPGNGLATKIVAGLNAQTHRPAKKAKAALKAVAAADQQNASARDERAASPTGMTASESAMARSAKAKPAKATKADKAKKPAKAVEPKAEKPKRLSALDAAAQVLAKAGAPMKAKEMVAEIVAKGLWKSPAGKTPEATLYAAIIREIAAKGRDARFVKTERGTFAARKG